MSPPEEFFNKHGTTKVFSKPKAPDLRVIDGEHDAEPKPDDPGDGVSLRDFHAYMPSHNYIFAPAREFWPASSINARIPPVPLIDAGGKPVLTPKGEPETISASAWLDKNRAVEQMTWCPGLPMLIQDRLVSQGGWIERPGCVCFNLYMPPTIVLGDAAKAGPWLDHVKRLYPDEADHIVQWLAHRAQKPAEKINHALVLGGAQGIGKDTILEPVKQAIGPWNFEEVSPAHMLGRFNGFVKNVILRVSEARDLGDTDRYSFYEHMKVYTAAPPDVLRCDEKNLRECSVMNCCGVIITSNHKLDGIFLPPDDRRHFVAWSDKTKDDFPASYWTDLYDWFQREGNGHVAAYLAEHDLQGFDAKAPPPKTTAFWDIVAANTAPEDGEVADALDRLDNPQAVVVSQLAVVVSDDFRAYLLDRRNSRSIPHRLAGAGYVAVRNPQPKDGQWVVRGKRQTVYARADLCVRDRIAAAQKLAR